MAELIGADEKMGFAKEATRGTAETTADFWVPVSELTWKYMKTEVVDEQGYGRIEDGVGSNIVKEWTEVGLTHNLEVDIEPLLLYNIFGTLSTSTDTPEAGTYTHALSVSQTHQHQALTAFKKDTLTDSKAANCNFTSWTFNAVAGEEGYLNCAYTGRAKKYESATSTPAYTSSTNFTSCMTNVKLAADLSGLAAASNIKAKSVSLTIEQNLQDSDILGSCDPDDFFNKRYNITGEIVINRRDTTYTTINETSGSYKALRIEATNTGVTIGSTTNPKITIDLARVRFMELDPNRDLNEIEEETISFRGFFSQSDTSAITISVINTTSSY